MLNILKKFFNLFSSKSEKEVFELIQDMKQLGYNNISKKQVSKEIISITGKKDGQLLNVSLDLKNNTMVQTKKKSHHILTPFLPNQEVTQIVKSTMGNKINTVRSIEHRFSDSNHFRTTTTLSDYATGNNYQKISTPSGSEYYKQINNNWVQLFNK